MMKLYYSKGSCSLAVRILINELNIACEYESVNLKTHLTQSNTDFYSINPKGAVPAIALNDGGLLTENNVIQQYLADTYDKSGQLLPKSGMQRYHTLEWMNYVSTEMHKGCSPFYNPNIPSDLKENVFKPMLLKKLSYLDKHLAKNAYVTGEHYHLPDAYLWVVLSWLPSIKINRAEFAHVQAYFEKLKARPAIMKSLEQE